MPRDRQHRRAEVEADRPPARAGDPGQLRRQLSGSTRDIEGRPAGAQAGLACGAAPPATVDAGGQDGVDQVVAARDAVEHRPHRLGIAFAQG